MYVRINSIIITERITTFVKKLICQLQIFNFTQIFQEGTVSAILASNTCSYIANSKTAYMISVTGMYKAHIHTYIGLCRGTCYLKNRYTHMRN